MGVNSIKSIVEYIVEELDELKGKETLTDMEFGQLLAYAESLSIIQSVCAGYDLAEIGLDFDVDEKYLLQAP